MPENIPIACSLDAADLQGRATRMAELGGSLLAVHVEGLGARLRFPVERRAEVDAFIAGESKCCPFFAFDTALIDGEVELSVTAPDDAEWAVKGLVAGFVAGWDSLV